MSRTIDERVVSMEFDNRKFESNVQTSLSTLDKLKRSLNLDGASKGLENINTAARSCNLSPLGNAAESIKMKFSAMEVMAVTALANITNSAVNAGKRIVSALTIDPVRTGLSEYETQLNAIQTILANTESKGTNLQQVNSALDELNQYADMTIYNFTEMTRNIGTFTAAGVDLNTSVAAIKGIANLAAVSGSTSQQASTAMYQLSQALATGTVKLMDWNSVVNAGMGGEVFQNALKRTATQMGTNVDALIEKYGSFRESLTQGNWLTAEVLTETLKQLSGAYTEAELIAQGYSEQQAKEIMQLAKTATDAATKVKTATQLWDTLKEAAQSGWAQTWRIIIGDFEEAKALWTGVSDYVGGFINRMSEARNNLLSGALDSNWEKLVKKVNEAGVATEEFEEKVKTVLRNHGYDVEELIEKYGSLEKIFLSGAVSSKYLAEALNGVNGEMFDLSKISKTLRFGSIGDDVKEAQKLLKALGYDLGKAGVDGIVGNYTEAAIKAFQKQHGLVEDGILGPKTLEAMNEAAKEASKSMGGLYESAKDLISVLTEKGGRELLLESLKNIFMGLIKPLQVFKKAWGDIVNLDGGFGKLTSEGLFKAIEAFNKFSKKLVMNEHTADKLRRTFRGLFAALEIVTTFVGGGVKAAFKFLSKLLGGIDLNILDFTAHIGDTIVKFRNWIFENKKLEAVLSGIADLLKKGVVAVGGWIKSFMELPAVQRVLDRVKTAFADASKKITHFFTELTPEERIAKLKSLIADAITKIKEYIMNFDPAEAFDKVTKWFKNIDFSKFVDKVKEIFGKFRDNIKKYFGEAGEVLSTLGSKISEFFSIVKEKLGDKMGTILAVGALLTFLWLVKQIKDTVETIAKPLSIVEDFLDGLGDTLKAFQSALKANAIKNIAISIAILAGSVVILALLPQGKVWSAVGAIAALSLVLFLLAKLTNKFEPKDFTKLSLSIAGLAGAILLMAIAARMIGGMDGEALLKGGGAVFAFLLMMTGVMAATKKMGYKNVAWFGKMMMQLAGAMLILSIVTKILGGMSWESLIKGGSAVLIFMGAIVGMMAATKLIDNKDMRNFGKMMTSLSTALLLMAFAIGILGRMKLSTVIQGSAVALAFIGLTTLLALVTKKISAFSDRFGKMMLGFGVSLLAMALAIAILGNMDPATVVKGGLAITALLGVMALMMLATKMIGKNSSMAGKVGLMMLAFAGSILIISGAILLLGSMGEDNLNNAVNAIAKLSLIFAGLIVVSKMAAKEKGGIIAIAIAVGVVAASVAALTFAAGSENFDKAVTSLISLMAGLAIVFAATKKIDVKIGPIATIAGAIILLAGILIVMDGMGVDSALKNAAALSLLMISLAATFAIVGKVGGASMKAVGAMALMGLVVGELAIILGLMSHFNVEPSIETAAAISVLLLAMSGSLALLTIVGAAWGPALIGIGVLAVFIAAVGGIIIGLGALMDKFPKLETFLDKGIPILEKIGHGLGSFFGNIVGGFAEGALDGFSELITGLTNLFNGVSDVDESAINGVKTLAEAILLLTGGELLDRLASIGSEESALSNFSTDVKTLGEAVVGFYNSVADLPEGAESKIETVTAAVKGLVEIANSVPETDGWAQTIGGTRNLKLFADSISGEDGLGEAIKDFNSSISGITNPENITSVASAISSLVDVANAVPETDGWLQKAVGVPNLKLFADSISGEDGLGAAIVDFNSSVSEITNPENITSVATAISSLVDVANAVPETDGWDQKINGVPNLKLFADSISGEDGLGAAIVDFNSTVSSITDDSITKMTNVSTVISTLAELANNVPETDGWEQKIQGTKSLATFATELTTFGEKIVTFSEKITDVTDDDISRMTKVAEAASTLVTVAASLKDYDDSSWFNTNLTEFADELSNFGEKMSAFSETVVDVDTTKMTSVINGANSLLNLAKNMQETDTSVLDDFGDDITYFGEGIYGFYNEIGGIDISTLSTAVSSISELVSIADKLATLNIDGFGSIGSALGKAGKEGVDAFIKAFDGSGDKALAAGKKMVSNLVKGVDVSKVTVSNAFKSVVEKAILTLLGKYTGFYNAGKSLVEGFAQGITMNTFLATAKAKAMAEAAEEAAREALDVNSPSKVFRRLGKSVPEGFAMGIGMLGNQVTDASESMAGTAIDGVRSSLSRISSIIDSDMDVQPTIRPVLDLSDVRSGASSISGLFNMTPSVGVMSNMSAINSAMTRIQNGGNDDIVSAIEGLGDRLDKEPGNNYNFGDISYDDGSAISEAVGSLVRAVKVGRRR